LWGLIPKLTLHWKKPKNDGYPTNPQTLGEQIRKRRMDLSLLQKDVAELLYISTDCVTNWENNHAEPQIQYFPAIIQFLGFYPFKKDLSTLGGQIQYYRFTHGLNHKKLGKLLDVNATTIASWESNIHTPKTKVKQLLLLIKNESL
jgi:DNA-binding transcriptional regulator YiaG